MNRFKKNPKVILNYCIVIISMIGFVPKHSTLARIIAFGSSLAFSIYLNIYHPNNSALGVAYFIIFEILYMGFVFLVLSKDGCRRWFMKWWKNDEDGYLAFEAILGFLFFHNAISLGYITSSSPGHLFDFVNRELLFVIVAGMSIAGFVVKFWSALAITVDIYYWKDLFLGRKVIDFVESGPYRILSNPIYGVGQIATYAFAIWCGSVPGIMAAVAHQAIMFTFYFTVEKKFIQKVYLGNLK